MSHYEERLQNDLAGIKARIEEVGDRVEEAFKNSIHAVLTSDRELAAATILGDLPINREIREIDRLCHAFVARHLPGAGHLRFVSSALRLNIELERVGDYAVAICRELNQLSQRLPDSVARDIDIIGDQAKAMLHQAMKAFNQGNAELARGTKGMAAQVGATYKKVFEDLLAEGEKGSRPVRDLFATLVIFNRIGRVGDQAKNFCEEALFVATGETKEPKIYRVLFVDETNSVLSQMAAAYARRAFPESGRYSSAGWKPAGRLDPRLVRFAEARNLDLKGAEPRKLDAIWDELEEFHVIVSLEGDVRPHIREVPFHTVLLTWDVGGVLGDVDQQRAEAMLEESHQALTVKIGDLMQTLRGEGAG
jgi:phosphate transport system protein